MLRPVTLEDLDLISRHRDAMFREAGRADADLAAMAEPFRTWLAVRLADGGYFGFIAEQSGVPIGGIGLMAIDWPPHPAHPLQSRRGYVLNLYVEPAHRGQGVARELLQAAEAEFARRGIAFLVLHATEAGRPVYEKLGWMQTPEMAKTLALGET